MRGPYVLKIQTIAGASVEIIKKPLPQDDPKVRQPDIAKAKEVLGWIPQVDFEKGMTETMKYFMSKLNLK